MSIDTESLRAEKRRIENELSDARRRVAQLEAALTKMDELLSVLSDAPDVVLRTEPTNDTTLLTAVSLCCLVMVDGITRQRVTAAVRTAPAFADAKENSVAAALATLTTKGDLHVVQKGIGRRPSYYTTQSGPIRVRLNQAELTALNCESITRGEGGWQNLMRMLRAATKGPNMTLDANLRKRIVGYLGYGSGGWQDKLRTILGRSLPHLFSWGHLNQGPPEE